MNKTHLSHPNLAINRIVGTDSDQDAESLNQIKGRQTNFAFGDASGDAGEMANYIFKKKALFFSSLRGPAAGWYENIIKASTRENVGTETITGFSDGRKLFQYRMEVEPWSREDGEGIRVSLYGIKTTVKKTWLHDLSGVEPA